MSQSGYKKISEAAKENGSDAAHKKLSHELTITEPGFVYIYLSNEEETPVEVFFDDFTVTQVAGPVIQMDDYYPFGLTFNSYKRENSIKNRYLYNQGTGEKRFLTERIFDLGLNIDLTKYRAFDPAIARWWQVDPLADEADFTSLTPYNYSFNNPVRYNDPYGDCPKCKEWWGAVKSWIDAPISKDAQAMGRGLMISSTGADVTPNTRGKFFLALMGQAGSRLSGARPGSLGIKQPKVSQGSINSASNKVVPPTTLNAKDIKFSQSSVNGLQVQALEQSMKQKGWQGPPVDVVETTPGNLVTLDNKRVLAASRTDTPVQAVVHAADAPLPTNYVERFTTRSGSVPTTFGEAVMNRIGSQASGFRTAYPEGSNVTGSTH